MTLITCAENRLGTSFNGRRLSRDRVVTEKILEIAGEKTLLTDEYSAELFEDKSKIKILENPLDKGGNDDFCFVELNPAINENVNSLIVFRWNRDYPFETKLDLKGFKLVSSEDFKGYSHEKITKECYSRWMNRLQQLPFR